MNNYRKIFSVVRGVVLAILGIFILLNPQLLDINQWFKIIFAIALLVLGVYRIFSAWRG